LRYSPDGKRLVAGDYPGGVVVVWDVATGKPLRAIETGNGLRNQHEYFFLSPDWQTLFVAQGKRKYEQVEQDGKRLYRWQLSGQVRTWDLTGEPLPRTFQHE